MASLGLYDDEQPLVASSWPAADRLWITSKIASFATNLVFIVGDCENPNENLKYNHDDLDNQVNNEVDIELVAIDEKPLRPLFLFHQEKLIDLPHGIRYVDEFLDYYAYKADIDFNQVCNVK